MKSYLIFFMALVIGSAAFAQDFIPDDYFDTGYYFGLRDKFLPEWQKIILKNKITREVYLTYISDKKFKPAKEIRDSLVIEYNDEGLPSRVTHYAEPDFNGNILLEPEYWAGKLTKLNNSVTIDRDPEGNIVKITTDNPERFVNYGYQGNKLTWVSMNDGGYFTKKGNNFVLTLEYYSDQYNMKTKDVYTYDKYGRKVSETGLDVIEKYKFGNNGLVTGAERARGDYFTNHYITYKNGLISEIKFKPYSSFGNFLEYTLTKVKYYK